MQTITSKDNSKLKAVRALVQSKKERQQASCFVMEGVRALSALKDGTALPQYTLREVWVSEVGRAVLSAPLVEGRTGTAVPTYEIPHEFMEKLSDCRTSQGVLGVVEYTPAPLEIHPNQGSYLLLDRVMDPGNMGTLIRSAVAFGFDGVLLHGDCVEVFNPKTVRATMGALPFSNVWRIGDETLPCLDKSGYELISTVLQGGEDLYDMEFGPKTVLVIGNEANGVSEEILKRSTRALSIPMSGHVESLNAAVAGSICMSVVGRG
jgi:TrmH family RNA methyltransferase